VTAGFSKAALARLHDAMASHVARGYAPGLVTALSRHGETHVDAIGLQSIGGEPMRRDTIFRIASMTKPVLAAAAMILVEEGRLRLDDSVMPHLPELADMKVLRSIGSPLDDVVPARRGITLRDLLTFRLGTGAVMAMPGTYPIQAAQEAAGFAPGPALPRFAPDDYMQRVGSVPLVHQPGEGWLYHTGADILGVLIARATGDTLGAFLQARIFGPLGMKDTGFSVPRARLDRLATSYQGDPLSGALQVWDEADGLWSKPPVFEAGGGGLVSTADDYLAFCRMMLGGGTLGAARILSRRSVALMTSDQLTAPQRESAAVFFGDSMSWGLGMAVCIKRNGLCDTPGRFGWDGGYGTSAYSDPAEDMVGILLTQRMMDSPQPPAAYTDFWTMAYAAID
jgi:CubicO group peptidase (beta-lactamase class C family)